MGIGDRQSFRAATALAGGVARQGETCGAIIGALSALGLVVGREKIEDVAVSRSAMDSATRLRSRLMRELAAEFGSSSPLQNTLCRHIQQMVYGRSFDLSRNDEFQQFLKVGGHGDSGCPKVCGVAARVTAEEVLNLPNDK